MNTQNKIRISTAPGPVSYPLLAYKMKNSDIELSFGKESSTEDAIFDSTVSLVKRGLRIDYVTVKRLIVISPSLVEGKIGVWRKGSAADILTRAVIDLRKVNAEIVYADDWMQLFNMLKNNQVSAATLAIALANGSPFEDLLSNVPGSCGVHINNPFVENDVVRIYNEGIEIMKSDPEGVSEYIVKNLPIRITKEFVSGVIKKAEFKVEKSEGTEEFYNLVKKYSG